jgi:methionyl-tRNA formyltransferase
LRIIIISSDEPIYVNEAIKGLIRNLNADDEVCGCVLLAQGFGDTKTIVHRVRNVLKTLGAGFFVNYAVRYIFARLTKGSITKFLVRSNIKKIQLAKSINHRDSLEAIKLCKPDILISIASNEIFRRPLIELARYGCLNLHTSLLPKYRGLMPTFWALKNGENEIGVSVFWVDEGIDSGPVVVQEKVKITSNVHEELVKRTKAVGVRCILAALDKIRAKDFSTLENHDNESSYNSFPTRKDVKEFQKQGGKFFEFEL